MAAALERHYTADEVAAMWRLDATTVRKIFRDEPGVLKIGEQHRRAKRGYVTLRIPESVVRRFHEQRSR